MEQRPYSKAIQNIPLLLWNQKFHYDIHSIPSLDFILNQVNRMNMFIPCFFNIRFKSIHLSTFNSPMLYFPFRLSNYILYAFSSLSRMVDACPSLLILLDV
jgi:hypothetical protein